MRLLYYDLTGDSSVGVTEKVRQMDERLRLMLELGDPEIIVDLRTNNGFKGTKFDIFWDEVSAYFEEVNHYILFIIYNIIK